MDFFKNGVRRCDVNGAEIYEGSIEQLKEQGLLHGSLRATFAVVTMEYDPHDKKHIDYFTDEEEAVERICQIARRDPDLNEMCRDCDNFGSVCHGTDDRSYGGCIMKRMDRQEFTEYNDALRNCGKLKGADVQ